MDKMDFRGRILNVQFGRGGKHEQEHYERLRMTQYENRDFEKRERPRRSEYSEYNQMRSRE